MKLIYNQNLKPLAQDLRKANNLAEVLLWQQIKSKKLGYQFLRQRPVGEYIIDFYCTTLNLAIEIDGTSHDAKIEADVKRQNMLESRGIRFLRFMDGEVRYNLESVVREIKGYLDSKSLPRKNEVLPLKKGE